MKTQQIWIGCLMLAGCIIHDPDRGGVDTPDNSAHDTSPPPVSSGNFCQQWARAACSDAVVSACQASNADDCRQSQEKFCHALVPNDVPAGVARNECIAAVGAAFKDADLRGDELALVLRLGGSCARVVTGSSRTGEDCSASNDCEVARGYTCVKKSDSETGTCQIPQVVDPGRDCQGAAKTCSDGFFCDGHNCIETLMTGESCIIEEECGNDGFCDDSGHCVARRAVNESCQSDIECERGICSDFEGSQVCTDRVVLSRADPVCANLR
jgi:hypothetical protein